MGEARRRREAVRLAMASNSDAVRSMIDQYELILEFEHLCSERRVAAALPMAVAVRVLVHDTQSSTSVLRLLGIKELLRYEDTARHIIDGNLLPNLGLVVMSITAGQGAEWIAPLAESMLESPNQRTSFQAWWTTPLLADPKGNGWSRKDLILHVANKLGGAHYDASGNADLRAIENDNALGWTVSDPLLGSDLPMLNGPLLPSIRQIGYEITRTLEELAHPHVA
jgi:hypothetical protein